MRVPGASQFLNSSILANSQGLSAQTNSVLSEAAGGISLLDAGRRINRSGIGISQQSRQRIDAFLSSRATSFNELFSLSGGTSATVDAALTQIAALQSSVPLSRNSDAVNSARGGAIEDAQSAADAQVDEEETTAPGTLFDANV